MLREVRLFEDHVRITIFADALHRESGKDGERPTLSLIARAARIRQGKDVRLILTPGGREAGERNAPLIALIAEAHAAQEAALATPERTASELAAAAGIGRHRFARLIRIAQLAPDIVGRCLDGTQPAAFTTASLFASPIPIAWDEQRRMFGFA